MADRMTELALKLADSTARADIECHTLPAEGRGLPVSQSHNRYWDTRTASGDDKHYVADALEYLELRGMLDRHPKRRHLVRFKESAGG